LRAAFDGAAKTFMKTYVRMFKPQFARLVESGAKLQTVRPVPKRMLAPGDFIDCREWTDKPYRSPQRKLIVGEIIKVEPIWFNGVTIIIGDEKSSDAILEHWEADDFARADGFENLNKMAGWFAETHGLPFRGIVVKWKI
jgi:hypothetical protein